MGRHSCLWNKRLMSSNRSDEAASLLEAQTFFTEEQGESLEQFSICQTIKLCGGAKHASKGCSIKIRGPWQGAQWPFTKSLPPLLTVPPRCARCNGNFSMSHRQGSVPLPWSLCAFCTTFSCNLSDFGFNSALGLTAKAPLQVSFPTYIVPVKREPLYYMNMN